MSIQAVAWVLEESKTRGVDRLVLISLANHANQAALCWPSQRTIAREAGIALGTVNNAVKRLVELGELVLEEEGSNRRSARYRLTFRDASSVHQMNADPDGQPGSSVHQMNAERSPNERSVHPRRDAAFTPGATEPSRTVKEPSAPAPPANHIDAHCPHELCDGSGWIPGNRSGEPSHRCDCNPLRSRIPAVP